jgi:endonuclease/exonuclease/phosphatase family metal-dependent hydrolase
MNPNNARRLIPVIVILIVAGGIYLYDQYQKQHPAPSGPAAGPGEYVFCTWNVENLFDDRNDKRNRTDEEYDNWFADNAADRELKYKRLAEALVRMNGGKGPDIFVAIEVESERAAELLREALNRALPEGATPYLSEPLIQEVAAGRHIAPAILTRVPAIATRKKDFGPNRILQAHFKANGHDLVVFATHWTSHRSDEGGAKRDKYADLVYGRANEIFHANPKADILVCGDFNDTPDDPAVREHLHTANLEDVRAAKDLRFLNLMEGKDPAKFGTHYYNKPLIYDQICVSPGLLDDEGWSCDVNSVETFTDGLIAPGGKLRKPWRFGNPKDTQARGFSDHFPVIVKLRVAGGEISK